MSVDSTSTIPVTEILPLVQDQISDGQEVKIQISDGTVSKIKIKLKYKSNPIIDVKEQEYQYAPIKLAEYQNVHVASLSRIFNLYPVGMDFSMLGSGKTYTSSYIAMHSDLKFKHVIVICPLSLTTKWNHMKTYHGVPICTLDTYNAIRSVKCSQPGNGLLKRFDYKQQVQDQKKPARLRMIDKVEFTATSKLLDLIKEGVLLIIDEFQHIKNVTAQFSACQAMIKAIVTDSYKYGDENLPVNNSRVLLLSGSPIDKVDQVLNIYRLIGVMKSDRLSQYNVFSNINEWRGFMDVYNMSNAMNSHNDEVVKFERGISFPTVNHGTSPTFTRISYAIFQHLLKRRLSSSMKMTHTAFNVVKFNAFYNIINEDDRALMNEGIASLSSASNFDGETVNFGRNGVEALVAITTAMQKIETSKISTFVRIADSHLTLNVNSKVVICVNYNLTIEDLCKGLKHFNPLVMTGKISAIERGKIIAKFAQNDNEFRLLIANLKVCSSGIDLDDKFGLKPRFCLVSPNYSSIDLYQLSHRFIRMDSKSNATVHMLYGKHRCEISILEALSKKSTIMKETTNIQAESGVVFPCDYAKFEEIDQSSIKDRYVFEL